MVLNEFIDHTLLKPEACRTDIKKLCSEALKYNFAAVCVNPCNVKYAAKFLYGSCIKVCSVAGFPFGASTLKTKIKEVKLAIADGANEIDMVINIGRLLDRDLRYVRNEIAKVNKICCKKKVILKVIVETCYLNEKNIADVCAVVEKAGAPFIKTSTGYGSRGADFEDIILFKKYLKGAVKIKASGGIKSRAEAEEYVRLGCARIGTSRGVELVKEDVCADS